MNDPARDPPAALSRGSSSGRPTTRRQADYAPVSETRALLAKGSDARRQRLGATDMISADEAARLVQTTRLTINDWISEGRAIGLAQTKRGYRMPRWQFEPSMWEMLPRLSAALGTTEGWALLSFLESPHGGLNGITPRQAIEQGQADKVIAIAEHEGN